MGLAEVVDAVRALRELGASEVRIDGLSMHVRFGLVAQVPGVTHASVIPPPEPVAEDDEDMLYHSSG